MERTRFVRRASAALGAITLAAACSSPSPPHDGAARNMDAATTDASNDDKTRGYVLAAKPPAPQ